MQGYTTLAAEAVAQMKEMKIQRPTHVLLQAGVGAMAGGVLGYLVDEFGAKICIPLLSSRIWLTVSTVPA